MRYLVICCAATMVLGCSSFRTTAIDRLDNDMIVVNPDRPFKGVPVSLRVPSHLELSIIETSYWEKKVVAGERPSLEPLKSCRPTRTVLHTVKETEKIFVVDPMRPGAGTQSYGFEFQSSTADSSSAAANSQGKGYLRNVKYKIDDQTITQSAELLASSLSMISALQTSVQNANTNTANLIATDRVVAFARFDINSPNYECDVAGFLECHLNNGSQLVCPEVCTDILCK